MSRERIDYTQEAVPMSTDHQILQRLDSLTAAVANLARLHGARLTRVEVCERLGIHRNTLRTYIDSRGFPGPGRDGKWLLSEVIEWEGGH